MITLLLLSLIMVFPASEARADNLIVNGGFEAPAISGWTSVNSIPGWFSTTNGIEIQRNAAGSPYEGYQHVELDAYANSNMIQNIATGAGRTYDLSFAYSPRPGVAVSSNGIDVYFNGSLLENIAVSGIGLGNTQWSMHHYMVTATGSLSSLEFRAAGISDSYGGYLDSVSMTQTAVPLPAAFWLLGSGVLGLLGIRRRISR